MKKSCKNCIRLKVCKNCNHFDKCVRVYNPYSCCVDYEAKPLTNEEWFCQLSTEDKAKWLSRNSKFMYGCGRMETTPKVMYEEDWECWLKEIHNDNA